MVKVNSQQPNKQSALKKTASQTNCKTYPANACKTNQHSVAQALQAQANAATGNGTLASVRSSGVSIGFCGHTHHGRRLQESFVNASILCQRPMCNASSLHPVSAILTFELQSWQSNLTQPLLTMWRRGNGQSEITTTKQAIGAKGNCQTTKLHKRTGKCHQNAPTQCSTNTTSARRCCYKYWCHL